MKISKIVPVFLLSALLLVPNISSARDRHFLGFYDKYEQRDDFVSLSLSSGILRLFLGKDDADLKQFLKNVHHLNMMVYEGKPEKVKYFNDELKQDYLSGWYDDLLAVKDGTDNIEFKVRMKDRKINELVMVVSEPGSLVVFYIEGEIELSKVKGLARSITVKGMNHLDQLPADGD